VSTPAGAVGTFAYDVLREAWSWTPEVYAMHGVDPALTPTDALLDRCRHPDDPQTVVALVRGVTTAGGRFSLLHRVCHPAGEVRDLLVVGEAERGSEGTVATIRGFYADVSDAVAARTGAAADEAVRAATEHRAAIEQAKGALSLAYGLTEDEAISLLRAVSSRRNLRLSVLAERLCTAVREGAASSQALRRRMDTVLSTVSRR
jgi:hypothetical protein